MTCLPLFSFYSFFLEKSPFSEKLIAVSCVSIKLYFVRKKEKKGFPGFIFEREIGGKEVPFFKKGKRCS